MIIHRLFTKVEYKSMRFLRQEAKTHSSDSAEFTDLLRLSQKAPLYEQVIQHPEFDWRLTHQD